MNWMKLNGSWGISTRFLQKGEIWDFHLRDQVLFTRAINELAKRLKVSSSQIVCGRQPHGVEILKVTETKADFYLRDGYDGYLTDQAGLVLGTFHADCVPLYFYDSRNHAIGLAHGGWRGTVAGIAGKMVDRMQEEYGSKAQELLVEIGPCISQSGYEVDLPVIEACKQVTGMTGLAMKSDGHAYLDLAAIHLEILLMKGVVRENIRVDLRKTDQNPTLFYSHRKEGKKAGRMMAWITLDDKFAEK